MTATADRFEPGRPREELRLVEIASGLLLLLDAYRLTGRLPLEVQVQTGRLRHAVKLAVQAEAARTATLPTAPSPAGSRDQAAALRAWIATQPWTQPGPVGWVYLLCFRDPTTGAHRPLQGNGCRGQYAGHYWGWTDNLTRRINQHRNPAGMGPVGWSKSPSRPVSPSSWPGWNTQPPEAENDGSRTKARPTGAVPYAAAPAAPSTQPPPSPPSNAPHSLLPGLLEGGNPVTRRATWLIDMGDGTWAVCCTACRIGLYRGPKAGADRAARTHSCEPIVPLGRRRRPA